MARGRGFRRWGYGVGGLVLVILVVLFATPWGKAIRDIWGTGIVQESLSKPERRTYDDKSTDENLKALYVALKGYEASEGQFPDAAKWMDQIAPRLVLNDLPKEEAAKKLVRPGLPAGQFGYAINDAVATKYKGDLPKGTILLFESSATARNAHGDPAKDALKGGKALTIEGDVKPL